MSRIVTDLPPCPASPNCVSTRSSDPAHRIEPIPYSAPLEVARARLLEVLRAMPGATVQVAGPDHIKAEFRTRVLRYVDDADFVLDEGEKRIHFRSASRVGHWDLGVNRRRMEQVRRAFQGEGSQRA